MSQVEAGGAGIEYQVTGQGTPGRTVTMQRLCRR
jgi:hypothetical protein